MNYTIIKNDKISDYEKKILELESKLAFTSSFISKINQGNYEIAISGNSGLDTQLSELAKHLQAIKEQEEERNWETEGVTLFIELLSNAKIDELADRVTKSLTEYLGANQSALFIVNEDNKDDIIIEMLGCYAYNKKKILEKKIRPGDGLIGQCYLEKNHIITTRVPQGYVEITSGLGKATPGNLLLVPLFTNDKIVGIIEILSFTPFLEKHIKFIKKIAENIARTILTSISTKISKELLDSSQQQTEELLAQEEELRQNMEELYATQEEMEKRQSQMEENESFIKAIFVNSPDAILLCEGNGEIRMINPIGESLLGYPSYEIVNEKISILFPFTSILETDVSNQELQLKKQDSSFITVAIIVTKIWVNTRYVYILVIKDLSARNKLEEDLKIKEIFTNAILNGASDSIFIYDDEGQIQLVNKTGEKKFGYKSEEIVGKLFDLIIGNSHERRNLEMKSIAGKTSSFKFNAIKKNGGKFNAELYLNEVLVQNKRVFVASIRDITVQYSAELEIAEKELKNRAIYEGAFEVILLLSDRESIQQINNAGEKMFGYSGMELMGKKISHILPQIEYTRGEFIARYATNKSIEVDIIKKNGTTIKMLSRMELVSFNNIDNYVVHLIPATLKM